MKWVILALAILGVPAPCYAQTGGEFDLTWNRISSGGTVATGGSFTLEGTCAQVDLDSSPYGGDFTLLGGFWAGFASGPTVSVSDPPQRPVPLSFDLQGFGQNPVREGSQTVRFSLASRGPTRFEILDLAGRRIYSHIWDELGPGEHRFDIGLEWNRGPGVYWLRLVQGSSQVGRKVVVTAH